MATIQAIIPGRKFHRLTALYVAFVYARRRFWLCRCECGNELFVATAALNDHNTRSCGCLKLELLKERSTKHGGATGGWSKEYQVWQSMLRRCDSLSAPGFKNYGGRGITVCDRWRKSFANFLADMGGCPSPKHSLDRIDNDGNYEPSNCRWATRTQQARNTRANRMIEFRGERRCVAEWIEILGLSANTVHQRLYRGWDSERALTVSRRGGGRC